MTQLRAATIRLAFKNPELQPLLLPLLKEGKDDGEKDAKFERGEDVPLSKMPEKLQDNAKNPPPSVQKVKKKMQQRKTAAQLGGLASFLATKLAHTELLSERLVKDLTTALRADKVKIPGLEGLESSLHNIRYRVAVKDALPKFTKELFSPRHMDKAYGVLSKAVRTAKKKGSHEEALFKTAAQLGGLASFLADKLTHNEVLSERLVKDLTKALRADKVKIPSLEGLESGLHNIRYRAAVEDALPKFTKELFSPRHMDKAYGVLSKAVRTAKKKGSHEEALFKAAARLAQEEPELRSALMPVLRKHFEANSEIPSPPNPSNERANDMGWEPGHSEAHQGMGLLEALDKGLFGRQAAQKGMKVKDYFKNRDIITVQNHYRMLPARQRKRMLSSLEETDSPIAKKMIAAIRRHYNKPSSERRLLDLIETLTRIIFGRLAAQKGMKVKDYFKNRDIITVQNHYRRLPTRQRKRMLSSLEETDSPIAKKMIAAIRRHYNKPSSERRLLDLIETLTRIIFGRLAAQKEMKVKDYFKNRDIITVKNHYRMLPTRQRKRMLSSLEETGSPIAKKMIAAIRRHYNKPSSERRLLDLIETLTRVIYGKTGTLRV